MRTSCTLLLISALILHVIELGSQSEFPSHDGDNPHDTPPHPARSAQPTESIVRARSRSPTLRKTFPSVLGFRFDDLEFIRLFPYINPHRIYELRRYVFPLDERIRLRTKRFVLERMPTGEQIVLSTDDGDVCAILQKSSGRHTILRGIFIRDCSLEKRVKMNINSGAFEELTPEEIAECPVSSQELIAKSYGVLRLSSQSEGLPAIDHIPSPVESNSHGRSKSPTLRQSFPNLLGYRFEDLELLRLIPYDYPNQIFELRRYVFPPDKPIGMRTKNGILNPMPIGEKIALSSSNGDVCAILDKASSRITILRPIFTSILGISERVRINMNSGEVSVMSAQEIAECPVMSRRTIQKSYRVFRL